MITSLSSWGAAYLPLEVAREVFANEHDVLAGSVLGESEARIVERGLVVSGRFHFASGCLLATWLTAVIADPRHRIAPSNQPSTKRTIEFCQLLPSMSSLSPDA